MPTVPSPMYRYRVHDTDGDDLGLILHPAPNLETGDIVVTDYDRRWRVTRYVENRDGDIVRRLLEVGREEPG
jgi:hypothetical protein